MLISILTSLALLLVAPSLHAIDLDSNYVAQLRRGIAFTMVEQFDSARTVFAAIVAHDSRDHAAMLYLAGVDHAEMMDREDFTNKKQFEMLVEKAIDRAEKAKSNSDEAPWAYLTIGNGHAYAASIEAKAGSWWTAMRRGLKAKSAYLEALELDPTLYDAYLGLGTYHYWKSAKTEFINWLPFVGDRKDDGVEELQIAVDSSLFSNDLALNSLIWIHLERKDPQSALKCAETLHAKYPNSRLVKWGMAFSNYAAGKFAAALGYFGEIITSLESDSTRNYFNLIECRYHRGMIFQSVNDTPAALAEFKQLLSYPFVNAIGQRQQTSIRKARRFVNDIEHSKSQPKQPD